MDCLYCLSDYGTLHKDELRTDISKKEEEIRRIQTQTGQLKSAIEKLQREFNASRNYGIIRRYRKLKEMTRTTIAEMWQCHNPMYEPQWVENNGQGCITCEQPFLYLRSTSM